VVFVSKGEVKSWPVVGQWSTLCGTVFINRQRRGLIPLSVTEMSQKLKQGANILLFPEGAATNGDRVLPFQTAPLAAPLRSRAIIAPITLAYQTVNEQPVSAANRDLIYCYDDMRDVPHFWNLLALRRIEVRVTMQPMIEGSRYEDNSGGRKKLAEDCYNRVSGRLRKRDCAHEDEKKVTRENSRGLFSS
jgi:1-acyl-sn-glycerol-3-phosphate acyltransferase